MAAVHNWMPVILQRKEEGAWLATDISLPHLLSYFQLYPAELLRAYRVSTLANHAAADEPDLIKPER